MFHQFIASLRGRRFRGNAGTAAAEARSLERVSDPTFKGWMFLDTCCISDLVKLDGPGEQERVREFVRGQDIVVPQTILQELRKASVIAERAMDALSSARVFLIQHPTDFWECDIWNFINSGETRNILAPQPLRRALFHLLDLDTPMKAGFERAERLAGDPFFAQIERDRAENVDEHKLVAMIWGKANEMMRKRYRMELSPADCRPENLPSLFTYYYAYYFRFLVQRHVKPTRNDFVDLAHACAAPYCRAFYAEHKLVQLLRQIQRRPRTAPTPYSVAKKMHRQALIDSEKHERARRSDEMRRETTHLLQGTVFNTQMELRAAVLAT